MYVSKPYFKKKGERIFQKKDEESHAHTCTAAVTHAVMCVQDASLSSSMNV